MKTEEKITEIKKLRCSKGYFSARSMAEMFADHGITMTRQTYTNKETGKTKFNVDEMMVLAGVFGMDLISAVKFFNEAN